EHRAPGGCLAAGIACHQTTAGWSFLFWAWIVVVRTVGLRRRARELAMRALYEADIGRQSLATVLGRVAPEVPDREQAFFRALCEGTWRERERIDALLAERTPRRLGMAGLVRNLPDGRVEIVVEGPKVMLEAFIADVNRGPMGAVIRDVQAEWEPPAGLQGFQIH